MSCGEGQGCQIAGFYLGDVLDVYWSYCEPLFGILCAYLPRYAPLVRLWWTTSSAQRYGSPKHPPNHVTENSKPSRREWTRLEGANDIVQAGRGNIELSSTNNISNSMNENTCQGSAGHEAPENSNQIMVTRGFAWSRTT